MIFISGDFTLEEANAFTVESFDNAVVPEASEFFETNVHVSTFAFSAPAVPLRLCYIIDTCSTVDYVDEYTFNLLKYIVENHVCPPEEEDRRARRERNAARRARRRRPTGRARLLEALQGFGDRQ